MTMIEIILRLNVVSSIRLIEHKKNFQNYILARASRIDEISSDYSQRRSHSSIGITDEKPFLNGYRDHDSYNVAPKLPSENGVDIKKRSRSFVRPLIRSAVPNSQIITITKRPSQSGHGNLFYFYII